MSVVYGLDNVGPAVRRGAVAIGVFDGVHWGHQAIFNRLTEVARSLGVHSVALTFDRHPAELLAPRRAPDYISTLEQRAELIEQSGVDTVLVAEFNSNLANLTHFDFVHEVLGRTLAARHVVVGSNFVFGKGRDGDVRFLESESGSSGLGVSVVSSVIVDGGPVSSTRIRALLRSGDVESAARLLGRKFVLRGRVVRGDRVGRRLGFPTANLEPSPRQALPGVGVYAVEVSVNDSQYSGVCSIGTNPTFRCGSQRIEVYLMSYEGNLYDRILDVTFTRRLRDQMTFETPERLVDQIKQDVEQAKRSRA